MGMFTKSYILAIALTLTAAGAVWGQACPPLNVPQTVEREFTTVSGKTLILPPVSGMECAEIDKTLARIDSTRYRGNAPLPHDKGDCPLLHYELLLAEENYNRCVIVRKRMSGGLLIMKRSQSQ